MAVYEFQIGMKMYELQRLGCNDVPPGVVATGAIASHTKL
jgi:hypothetical protein